MALVQILLPCYNKFLSVFLRVGLGLGLWCLRHFQQNFSYIMSVSTEYPEKTTDLPQVTDKLSKTLRVN